MAQLSTAESAVASFAGGRWWRRLVALATAAALTLLGLLAVPPAASAAEPVGYVTDWGQQDYLNVPDSLASTGATAIVVGGSYGLALTPDGKAVRWRPAGPWSSDVPTSLNGKKVVAIAAGTEHSLALTSDGKITVWGYDGRYLDQYPYVYPPASLNGKTVTAIAAGGVRSAALTSDGQVTAWGEGWFGEDVVPTSLDGRTVTAIALGENHDLALTSDGKVTGWGNDASGQADVPSSLNGRTVTAISAGGSHSLALTSDGKVTAWGNDTDGQADVPSSLDGRTVTAISAGESHSLALTSDGKVTAWGDSSAGQTDLPSSLNGSTVTAIAAGGLFSLALTQGRSPVVATSPAPTKVEAGREASFRATATGSPTPTVQWQRAQDGGQFEDVPGATGTTFTLYAVEADDGATFRAVFTNAIGSVTTAAARLSVNRPPTAVHLNVTAGFGSATPVTLSGTDPDGDTLTYAVVSPPRHGTLTGRSPSLTYTPDKGYDGPDSFTYRATDGTASSAPAAVSITVAKKINNAPTAADLQLTAGFGSATPVALFGTDLDGEALTYGVVRQPEHGRLTGTAPTLTYTPDDGYSGADSFTYRVSDGTASSAIATVRLTVTPRPCVPATPKRTFTASVDQRHADGAVRTPKLTTKKAGELLLAFVAADGSTTRPQSVTGVSGAGLTWTLVRRENTQQGTSEVWQAYAAQKIRKTRVGVDLAEKGRSVSVTVAGFSRAAPAVSTSAGASGTRSTPAVSLTPRATGSSVWAVGRAVGSRYDAKPVAGQKIVHAKTFSSPRTGHWTQRVRAAGDAGTEVTVQDRAAAASWGYLAVEIPGACR